MYPKGSTAGEAFRQALALPCPKPIEWGDIAAKYGRTGNLPADDFDATFPAEFVARWVESSGIDVGHAQACAAARRLHEANSALVIGFGLSLDTLALSFGSREREGVSTAARKSLTEIASTATRLRSLLAELRGELLYQGTICERNPRLEHLHQSLHEAFYDGQQRRQALRQDAAPVEPSSFHPLAEVGHTATLASTWLEDGLACLADTATDFTSHDDPFRGQKIDPAKAHRDEFIRAVAAAWEIATGTAATSTGRDDMLAAGRVTPFQQFHQAVCGHICGLLVQRLAGESAPRETQDAIKGLAKRLGLAPVPSSSTLRRALAGNST